MACETTSRGASSCRGSSVEHEPLAVHVPQVRPLAADGLADQGPGRPGDVQDRRVELHELHVPQFGPGPPGGGHAVAGRDRRVGRLAVDHPAPAGRQDHLPRPDERAPDARPPDDRPDAPAFVGQQVERERLAPEGDVRRLPWPGR